jgi:Flp pilus assembly protein TadG
MSPHPDGERAARGRSRRGERGQGLGEFALFTPLVVFVVIGMVEIGRVHLWHVNLAASAYAGALYAAQSAADAADTEAVREHVLAELTDLPRSTSGTTSTPEITITMGPPAGDGYGKQQVSVSVNVSVPALFSLPGLPKSYTITEQASARILEVERRS